MTTPALLDDLYAYLDTLPEDKLTRLLDKASPEARHYWDRRQALKNPGPPLEAQLEALRLENAELRARLDRMIGLPRR